MPAVRVDGNDPLAVYLDTKASPRLLHSRTPLTPVLSPLTSIPDISSPFYQQRIANYQAFPQAEESLVGALLSSDSVCCGSVVVSKLQKGVFTSLQFLPHSSSRETHSGSIT